jgi:uncharacterized repeat protein (TIGR01451 family)
MKSPKSSSPAGLLPVGRWVVSAGLATVLCALCAAAPAWAQSGGVPTGYQEYFVLGHEQHIWEMMDNISFSQGYGHLTSGTNSVVSMTASADNQIIWYDQWEDGLEADPVHSATHQASTLVLGDGDLTNGRACDYTTDSRVTCAGANPDRLFQGTNVTLNSDQGLGAGCAAGIRCSVTIPRSAAEVRYDGGDHVYTSGGPIDLIHTQDPLSPHIGGAVEIYSRQAVAEAYSYSIPVGTDLCPIPPGCDNTVNEPFRFVDIDLVAFDNNTSITINNGLTTVSIVLNRGQHYSTRGRIDMNAATAITIRSGTKIQTSAPIAATLSTGGYGNYANRFYALEPDRLHSTDYVIAAPGDNAAIPAGDNPNRPLNLYIFNPDPLTAITVSATDTTGTRTFNVPANSMLNYYSGAAPFRYVPVNSTVRLTSDRNFWGINAYDHQNTASDWGDSWMGAGFLSTSYTVAASPGVTNPVNHSTNRLAACRGGAAQPGLPQDAAHPGPAAAAGACDSANYNPVFISPVLDNTYVQVDFNNDGIWDRIDTNSDDFPDAPDDVANTAYRVNTLQSLKIYDWYDYDNTGTRIVSTAPIDVSYGQDTDQAPSGAYTPPGGIERGPIDTGFTVIPIDQRFLDPALTIAKNPVPTYVPSAGGDVTFTLTVRSYQFGPLTSLTVSDLLPATVPGTSYVTGSTLITYPDYQQDTQDPTITLDAATGRWRLSWTLTPNTLQRDSTLTIRYTVHIPAGTPQRLKNDAYAQASLGGSTFSPTAWANVVRTDVAITKAESDDGVPEAGDIITYSVSVRNNGATAETNAVVTDPIPIGTTFVAGSITNAGTFTGAYSAAQNAVVWTAASFAAGAGPFTLTFQVRIDPTVTAGTVLTNEARYRSDQTPTLTSAPVQTTVMGPQLTQSKSATPPTILHPGEVVTFDVLVQNVGSSVASNVTIRDPLPLNATYAAGSMSYSLNGGAFTTLTDAADADQGTLYAGSRLEFVLATLGAGQDVTFRFEATVNAGTAGSFVVNQATVYATAVAPVDTNLVQIPIVGNATVTGHVFLDLDGDGTQDAGEPGIANLDVLVQDSTGVTQRVTTNAAGDYSVVVPAGATTLTVDRTDPDFPRSATLTTGNDPQTVTAVSGGTVASGNVGFAPPPIVISKTSSAGGEVIPGQTVTYTIRVVNNTTTVQSGLQLTDALPAGTAYATGVNSEVRLNTIRAREYQVDFATLTYTMTLDWNLSPDYFVIVQGADGDGSDTNRNPNADYVSLTNDPFGTGDFVGAINANQLVLTRQANAVGWHGVVTVVECVGGTACDTQGFRLRAVQRVVHANALLNGSVASAYQWSSSAANSHITLLGGFNGPGCDTGETQIADHKVCHVRLYPSGTLATSMINWTRDAGGATSLTTATSTVMVLEWGSEWTVQRATITNGAAGADGMNVVGAYNTAALGTAVARANTWVWGTGHTNDNGVGDAAEGVVITPGDGVATNATVNTVAVGIEVANNSMNFEVYALTHPNLRASHTFKADGDAAATTYNLTVPASTTIGHRMALEYNSCDGTGTQYPRPMLSARYSGLTAVQMARQRANAAFAAWVQGIDFANFFYTAASRAPSANLVVPGDGFTLAPGGTMIVTYQATVDNPPAAGITSITNTASFSSTQQPGPYTASVTDQLIRPGVTVEPNNAGFAYAGTLITYNHEVTNTGSRDDSYTLTARSDHGWLIELVDPQTGGVIARDTNGDGTWDGGATVNTGTLAANGVRRYQLRVSIPLGTPAGTEDSVRLTATSSRGSGFTDEATDETTVLASGGVARVDIVPDNSGVVTAGSSVVYPHRVYNNTGATDTFDLQIASEHSGDPTWSLQIYGDTNGDGEYTPGVDLVITNTAQLANGQALLFFTVVNVPAGTADWTVDVAHITATSRTDATLFDAATDTTTVLPQGRHDLSGGGSRMLIAGQVGQSAVFPGTLLNLGSQADTYELTITESSLNGLDAFTHPTTLWIDTNADGTPDRQIAADSQGDGTWETVDPAYRSAGGLPQLSVPSGGTLAYELRRALDAGQEIPREWVSMTSRAASNGEEDNITATVVLAAVTRASVRGLRVDPAGGIDLAIGFQHGTRSFDFYATDDPRGRKDRRLLNAVPVPAGKADSLAPITYRIETDSIVERYLVIVETETDGRLRTLGPFEIGDRRLASAFARVDARLRAAGAEETAMRSAAPSRFVRLLSPAARRQRAEERAAAAVATPRPTTSSAVIKIATSRRGQMTVPLSRLAAAGSRAPDPRRLVVTNFGRRVPHLLVSGPQGPALTFPVEALSTDYTGDNVYVISAGAVTGPSVRLTVSGDAPMAGATRIEKGVGWVADAPDGQDPWVWDELFSDSGTWPYPDSDPEIGSFDLSDMAAGVTEDVAVRLRLYGASGHEHVVDATLNGWPLGSVSFEGRDKALLSGTVPGSMLAATGNALTLNYAATPLAGTDPAEPGHLYLDYLELDVSTVRAPLAPTAVESFRPELPILRGVQYLIVTHPHFRTAADRLAVAKRAQGLMTVVVDVDRAYDRFGGGIVEGRAVQALIRYAAKSSGRLRFVVLIGDDTFDPRDFLGTGARSYVPSLWTRDSGFGRIPSENLYADLDGDGRPELAIGRLPVGTAGQAEALVDKIVAQTTLLAAHADQHLVAVDNDNDEDAPFADEAAEMTRYVPVGVQTPWADLRLGAAPARSILEATWRNGAAVTSYFGHGGPEVWADEQLVTIDDVDRLGDAIQPTVILDWACQSQWYTYLWGDTVNEALLRVPGGGAVASFGPVGITPPASQRFVYEALYPALGSGETLGEMIRRAKRAAMATHPGAREAVEGFALLGDPALLLPPPAPEPD